MKHYSPTCSGAAVTHMSGAAATAMRTPSPPPASAAVVHCWCSALTLRQAGEEIAKDVTEMEKFYGINEDDDSGNDDADPDAEVDGMAAKLAGWEKRKLKYEKYAEKGKPEKLEKAMEKQRAKLQKATDKGKPQEYLMYKAEKIEFTQKMWTLAHLVANMKRAGFLPQC